MSEKKKVVAVGGGTGMYTLLRGLRNYSDQLDISAVVTMADSGGSTGRLRDEFGYLPVGDIRQALAALSPDSEEAGDVLRKLFLYRFDRGEGLAGHNFGNLFLTALTEILGSEAKAIEASGRLLRVGGNVIPVTVEKAHLVAKYTNGLEVIGEHAIDEPTADLLYERIVDLRLDPVVPLYEKAKNAITSADVVVFGPGDLYTSLIANFLVEGMTEALSSSQAKFVYIANLMSRPGQTIGMHAPDYVSEIKKYAGVTPHIVIVPQDTLPTHLVDRYRQQEGVHPVGMDDYQGEGDSVEVWRRNVVSEFLPKQQQSDVLTRSYIRHDGDALAQVIFDVLHR